MTVRFTRIFGSYTLFSVFIPGMIFLIGILPIVSIYTSIILEGQPFAEISNKQFFLVLQGLVFLALGLFSGFGLHSLGELMEDWYGDVELFDFLPILSGVVDGPNRVKIPVGKPHRELFREMLNEPNDFVHKNLVSSFLDIANSRFSCLGLDPDAQPHISDGGSLEREQGANNSDSTQRTMQDESSIEEENITEEEADAIYTLARGEIHMDQTGRSRTFQAVFASCRTMFAAWTVLTLVYTITLGGKLLVTTDVATTKFSIPQPFTHLETTISIPNLYWILASVVIIGFVGAYGFAYIARNYKYQYLEYLISDFVLLHTKQKQDDPDRSRQQDSQQVYAGSR